MHKIEYLVEVPNTCHSTDLTFKHNIFILHFIVRYRPKRGYTGIQGPQIYGQHSGYTSEALFEIFELTHQVEAELQCGRCGVNIPSKARRFMRSESVAHPILMADKPPRLGVKFECSDSGCRKIHLGAELPIRKRTGKSWCADFAVSALLYTIRPGSQAGFGKNPPRAART